MCCRRDPNNGLNVATLPDLMVLLQGQIEAFIVGQSQKCNMDLFALHLNVFNWFCTYRTELSVSASLSSSSTHSMIGWKVLLHVVIKNPVVFLSHSVNLTDSPSNVGGFPRPLMPTKLCRSCDRGFA